MRKYLTFCLLLSVAFSGSAFGQGKNTTKFVAEGKFSANTVELATGNPTIPTVLINLDVSYRLSSLLGEPVANYALKWDLVGFSLFRDKQRGATHVGAQAARERLGSTLDRLEISLRGLAYAQSSNSASPLYGHNKYSQLTLDFDTGAATKAGQQSWNVAGSPAWNRFFLEREAPCDGAAATARMVGATGSRVWIGADITKEIFRVGDFSLNYKGICKRGTAIGGLDRVADAIRKLCASASGDDDWCPAKSTSSKASAKTDSQIGDLLDEGKGSRDSSGAIGDLLDEKAETPQVERKLADLRKAYRSEAESACRKIMQGIEACFARNGCAIQLPENVTVQQCDSISSKPNYGKLRLSRSDMKCDSDCERRIREEDDREYEYAMNAWRAKYGELDTVCKPYRDSRRNIQSCRKENQASCNPDKLEKLDDCVSNRIKTAGPSERDAREAVRKEWQNKSKQPGTQPVGSFLD